MDFFNNFYSSFQSLPPERKKLVYILIGVLFLFFIALGILTTVPLSGSESQVATNQEEEPEITASPEEIAIMTRTPIEPTNIQFISEEDTQIYQPTPTITPKGGPFYIPDGTHNEIDFRIYQRNPGDTFDEVQLVSYRTNEVRLLAYAYDLSPGDSAFFSKDFSQAIFIGGPKDDFNKINIYSMQYGKVTKTITLDEIRKTLPGIKYDPIAVLSNMIPSPDKTKIAVSYGLTFNTTPIHPETQIIIINLQTNKMQLLPVKGLVKVWKDETTLEYEVDRGNPIVTQTLETTITGI